MTKENKLLNKDLSDKVLIKCWGEAVTNNMFETRKYLSYVIDKENFKYLKDYIKNKLLLSKFDYVEIVYNQCLDNVILDFKTLSNDGEEKVIETNWDASIFFDIRRILR